MSIVRPAEAADLPAATSVLLAAFEGLENARLGAGYARAFLASFLDASTRSLLVAEEGGGVVGFAAAEQSDLRAERYRTLRTAAAIAFMRRPWLALRPDILSMTRQRLSMTEGLPPRCWFLSLIGVAPHATGRGVGHSLLDAFEQEGRERGFGRAILFVRDDNAAARAFYERAGWQQRRPHGRGRITYELTLSNEASQRVARAQ